MAWGDVVHRGVITLPYTVSEWVDEDFGPRYDWTAANGVESEELFDSLEEAIADIESRY